MGNKLKHKDPRGHSLRVYHDVYESPAFKALSPHDVMAYLAFLRELKGYNNGDLSLPLSRARDHGIKHHITLARSLRALCAVGLVALTRKGGCTKGGQRLPSLYRVTDRPCVDVPAKHLEAMPETNEWKRIKTIEQAEQLIQTAEDAVKKGAAKLKTAGHGVTATRTPHDVFEPMTTSPRDVWTEGLGHGVTMARKAKNPVSARASAVFSGDAEKASHRTPHIPPLYVATPMQDLGSVQPHGSYQRLMAKPAYLFSNLTH